VTQDSLHEAMAVSRRIFRFQPLAPREHPPEPPRGPDEQVWKAAIAARCHEFIEALPDGLQTLVGIAA
jgi:hypothetical protein